MNRQVLLSTLALALAGLLGGCVTEGYQYRDGPGDYYYGQPSTGYYDDGYGYGGYGGYGGGWGGSLGLGYGYGGYGGYGYPYGGYGYGGYWNPYFPRPPIIIVRHHRGDGHDHAHHHHDGDGDDDGPPDHGPRPDRPPPVERPQRPPPQRPLPVPSRPRPLMSGPLPSRPLESAPLPARPMRPAIPMAPISRAPRNVDFTPSPPAVTRPAMHTPESVGRDRDGRRSSRP